MNTNLPTGNATDPAMGATEPDPSGQRCYVASAEVEDILFDQLQYLITHAGHDCPSDCLECGRLERVKHWLLLPFQKPTGAAA